MWGAEPNRWFAAETRDLPAGRALDLAAGEGRNAIWLARHGWQVTAVDFSSVALERGRRLADAEPDPALAERISWLAVDVLTYRPPAAAFSLVSVVYLQLPAQERRQVMRLAAEAVAPGGVLLVIGHDTTNLTEGVGGPQDAAVLFTPDDILADVVGTDIRTDERTGDEGAGGGQDPGAGSVTGWQVERAERVLRPVLTSDGTTRDAIDALVRLRRDERS
jgi:SAM-dependent methyltransferase